MSEKSFIEKIQNANFGKRGIYIGVATLVAIVIIKLFVTPLIQPYFENGFWRAFKQIVKTTENLVMLNIFAFFICIIFFKNSIGGKIIYAMQLKDKSYFKDKWILLWMQSLLWCFVILGITTVVQQALFKSWNSFFFLCLFICIPFLIMPRLQKMQQNRFK